MPAITRIGDADITHCSDMTRAQGSTNVFVNGIGISRQGDNNTTHLKFDDEDFPNFNECNPHAAPITTGSSSVFINGLGCGRVGDGITGCTSVAEGSSDCFAGD